MAYTNINTPPACIDEDYVDALFGNLEYLRECAEEPLTEFSCTPVDCELVLTRIGETCCDIGKAPTAQNPNLSNPIDKKMFVFTSIVDSSYVLNGGADSNNTSDIESKLSIYCDGEFIEEIYYNPDNEMVGSVCFDCAINSQVSICFESSVATGSALIQTFLSTATICGALVCVGEVAGNEVTGYTKPPDVDATCKYGREALYLVNQDLTALCSRYAQGPQTVKCLKSTIEGVDNIANNVLYSAVQGDADYMIIGDYQVCAQQEDSVFEAYLTIKPIIGCEGEAPNDCIDIQKTLPVVDEGFGPNALPTCYTVPFVTCGSCSDGQTLYGGLTTTLECLGAESTVSGAQVSVTSVIQNYCIYIFERDAATLTPLNDSFSNCIKISELQAQIDKMKALKEVCENQNPINLTTRELTGTNYAAGCATVQEAIPFTPTVDVPDVPIKKWQFMVDICSYFTDAQRRQMLAGGSPITTATMKISITCGGTPLVEREVSWTARSIGGSTTDGQNFVDLERCLTISECVECATNEDLEFCIETELDGNGTTFGFTNRQVKLFCF